MDIRRSTLKLFVARLLTTVTTYVGLVYFSNVISQSKLGIFFLFEATLGMVSILANLGINGSVEKRISEEGNPEQVLSTSILLKLAPLITVSALIFVFRAKIEEYVGGEVGMILIVALFLSQSSGFVLKVIQGELKVGQTAVLRLADKLTWLLVSVLLLQLGMSFRALIYGYVAGMFVMLLLGLPRITYRPGKPDIDTAKSIVDYSKYNFISFSLAGYFYNWVDVAIIGFFLSSSAVASYEIAWRVSIVAMLFSDAIATTIFPQISSWAEKEEYTKIQDLISDSIVPSLFFVIPIFFGSIAVGEELLGVVFGPEYRVAWAVLVILMFEKIFRAVHIILGHALQALDYPDLAARSAVVAVVLNIVLNLILVPLFGINGAAVATATAFIVNTVLHINYLDNIVSIPLPKRDILWSILAGATIVPAAYMFRKIIKIQSLKGLLVIILVGSVIYTFVAMFYTPIRQQMVLYVRTFLHS